MAVMVIGAMQDTSALCVMLVLAGFDLAQIDPIQDFGLASQSSRFSEI